MAKRKTAATKAGHAVEGDLKKPIEEGPGVPPDRKSVASEVNARVWTERKVSKMDVYLRRNGGPRVGKNGVSLPVFVNPFKCDLCDEMFQHITNCHIKKGAVDEKGKPYTSYRQHLEDVHAVEKFGKDCDAGPRREPKEKETKRVTKQKKKIRGDSKTAEEKKIAQMQNRS